jgi:hypothetical protein
MSDDMSRELKLAILGRMPINLKIYPPPLYISRGISALHNLVWMSEYAKNILNKRWKIELCCRFISGNERTCHYIFYQALDAGLGYQSSIAMNPETIYCRLQQRCFDPGMLWGNIETNKNIF